MRLRRRVLRSFAFDIARSWATSTDLVFYAAAQSRAGARHEVLGLGQTTVVVQILPEMHWQPALADARIHEAAALQRRRLEQWIDSGHIRASWIVRCVLELMIVPMPVAGRGPGLVVSACSILDDRGRSWSAAFRFGTLGRDTL